ncbi:MAG: UDP-glucose 6-dehydrogenase, partial [Acidimicrobiia bacterium]|nr:UDP-glucose 6-dehydrogenase [Acidimicrobiia bacterium]
KPGTDDVRDAPAETIAKSLAERGVLVRACDPMVTSMPGIPELCMNGDPYEAARDADAVVLLTEWPDFVDLDFVKLAEQMRGRTVIDGRNAFDPEAVIAAGLTYEGVGRYAAFPG